MANAPDRYVLIYSPCVFPSESISRSMLLVSPHLVVKSTIPSNICGYRICTREHDSPDFCTSLSVTHTSSNAYWPLKSSATGQSATRSLSSWPPSPHIPDPRFSALPKMPQDLRFGHYWSGNNERCGTCNRSKMPHHNPEVEANVPNSFELFTLGPGEKKVEETTDTRKLPPLKLGLSILLT